MIPIFKYATDNGNFEILQNFLGFIPGLKPRGSRQLSLADGKINLLLIDKIANFDDNDFSSAGAPLEIMKEFNLPKSIVGTFWNKLRVATTKNKKEWVSKKDLGVVLDFTKLKKFLIKEAKLKKCDVLLGYKFVSFSKENDSYNIKIQNTSTSKKHLIKSKLIVDATGPVRAVLNPKKKGKEMLLGIGLEHLIKIENDDKCKKS